MTLKLQIVPQRLNECSRALQSEHRDKIKRFKNKLFDQNLKFMLHSSTITKFDLI